MTRALWHFSRTSAAQIGGGIGAIHSDLQAPHAISQACSRRVQLERAAPCWQENSVVFPLCGWWSMSGHASAVDGGDTSDYGPPVYEDSLRKL